ncbi:bifunctional UDP-N-acetylglucosamine pyrophosphorylase / Glucosamine-1-phosphate N-acetyltransferase [Acetitomaculum ruminis DSM 5522]|uniref:Bifunctional UDP-N-acetylglucosamine pyrophosphorylase / Glucosamine-1-phosphate N-acetyltransferase n=1 Tax=Acetitomaculum ruminis DSM 5522 TaxID=1120918 RepID=A0A1I0X0I8_9FIRM|nr:sugar phosphate nucleotidyltransferase [Acetitomaculum ruminis]SFA93866.1 bifunctional UDP-N-acetylglucosamine pyrophosphorylase / Glucosamine-1-phosphate N-acetyltransferase [Acetitomaculum ruminis DSM 5522]
MATMKALILAAGKGSRMKSDLPKVVHKINDKCLAEYVIDEVKKAGVDDICLVTGYKEDIVKANINREVSYVNQPEQLGTGHAVMCAKDFLGNEGSVLILCGDTPLIRAESLKNLMDFHIKNNNMATVLSAKADDPTGYGRIVRNEKGEFLKNVEHKDASIEERKICEINSGMYVFDCQALSNALSHLKNDNAQNEYYLPDAVYIIKNMGQKVDAMMIEDMTEIAGVNTKEQLEYAKSVIDNR